ncbi:hypothetical protein JL37_17170 [Achromobacter sp. RTa]|nr:hypothetical protein JL37_17170 [Achromobacter sp. RTa]
MAGILIGTAVIAAGALGAGLLRYPGVVLYDWIATRSRRTSRPVRTAAPGGPGPLAGLAGRLGAPARGEKKAIR